MGETCPVVVRDQHFPSMKAAAAHFGLGQSAVSQALRRRGDLETLGLPQGEARRGKVKPARPVKTVLFDVEFPSRCAAARALRMRRNTIREVADGIATKARQEIVFAALQRHGYIETPGDQVIDAPRVPCSVRTVLFGVEFPSRNAAARALSVPRETVREVAEGLASQAKREIVYGALIQWQTSSQPHARIEQ